MTYNTCNGVLTMKKTSFQLSDDILLKIKLKRIIHLYSIYGVEAKITCFM